MKKFWGRSPLFGPVPFVANNAVRGRKKITSEKIFPLTLSPLRFFPDIKKSGKSQQILGRSLPPPRQKIEKSQKFPEASPPDPLKKGGKVISQVQKCWKIAWKTSKIFGGGLRPPDPPRNDDFKFYPSNELYKGIICKYWKHQLEKVSKGGYE